MGSRKVSNFIVSPRSKGLKKKIQAKKFISIVLLEENYGHRMKSYGSMSLLKIGSKTLIEHQMEAIDAVFPDY